MKSLTSVCRRREKKEYSETDADTDDRIYGDLVVVIVSGEAMVLMVDIFVKVEMYMFVCLLIFFKYGNIIVAMVEWIITMVELSCV